ncbi:hypothetical protein [uncultured Brevundimonas sp.]|uniref:hypothetical protein n=1 Tax=uncultured Brevundimonas sp. TaxID=213418 RepID=UPI00260441F4|nr:hypothetical protein [uncultured Brevundimonas sp.]
MPQADISKQSAVLTSSRTTVAVASIPYAVMAGIYGVWLVRGWVIYGRLPIHGSVPYLVIAGLFIGMWFALVAFSLIEIIRPRVVELSSSGWIYRPVIGPVVGPVPWDRVEEFRLGSARTLVWLEVHYRDPHAGKLRKRALGRHLKLPGKRGWMSPAKDIAAYANEYMRRTKDAGR